MIIKKFSYLHIENGLPESTPSSNIQNYEYDSLLGWLSGASIDQSNNVISSDINIQSINDDMILYVDTSRSGTGDGIQNNSYLNCFVKVINTEDANEALDSLNEIGEIKEDARGWHATKYLLNNSSLNNNNEKSSDFIGVEKTNKSFNVSDNYTIDEVKQLINSNVNKSVSLKSNSVYNLNVDDFKLKKSGNKYIAQKPQTIESPISTNNALTSMQVTSYWIN